MVVLSNGVANPSNKASILMEKLRQAKAKQQAAQSSNNEQPKNQQQGNGHASKKPAIYNKLCGKRLQLTNTQQSTPSSSGSSPDSQVNQKTQQRPNPREKLFARLKLQTSSSNSSNSSSPSNSPLSTPSSTPSSILSSDSNSDRRSRREIENDDEFMSTARALHLKKPMLNHNNESMYYDSRGRMDAIDWSQVHKSTNESSNTSLPKKSSSEQQNKAKESPLTLAKLAETAPRANPLFLNYVNNTTPEDIRFRVQNNLEEIRSAVDSPLLKIERLITNNGLDAIIVPQSVKRLFKESREKTFHIMDAIDAPIVKVSETNGKCNLNGTEKKENGVSRQLDDEEDDDVDKAISRASDVDNLSLLKKKSSELKRTTLDDDDDERMFVFQKPVQKSVSTSSMSSTSSSSIYETRRNTESSSREFQTASTARSSYVQKFKETHCQDKLLDSSMDSDDLSLTRSSELDDLSVSRREASPNKFASFKSKLLAKSRRCSAMKPIQNTDISSDEKKSSGSDPSTLAGEFLMKEVSTRYFEKSNDSKADVKNDMEGIKTVAVNQEPLLKEVSTRYFPKTKMIEDKVDVKKSRVDAIEEVKEVSNDKVENLNFLKNEDHMECAAVVEKTSSETSTIELNGHMILNDINNTEDDGSSTVSDRTCSAIILHRYEDVTQSSVVIQEIDKSKPDQVQTDENNKLNDENSSIQAKLEEEEVTRNQYIDSTAYLADYEDIDPDEEFDIVNLEGFTPFASIVDRLQRVQKSIAAEINNNDCDQDDSLTLKSIDSIMLESSGSHYSASVSSNLDSSNDPSSLLLDGSKNIFENVKIDENQLTSNNSPLVYFDNTPKSSSAKKTGDMSFGRRKMASALMNYQKNLRSAVVEEQKKPVEAAVKPSMVSFEFEKRHQILEEVKRRNLHLKMRDVQVQAVDKARHKLIRL